MFARQQLTVAARIGGTLFHAVSGEHSSPLHYQGFNGAGGIHTDIMNAQFAGGNSILPPANHASLIIRRVYHKFRDIVATNCNQEGNISDSRGDRPQSPGFRKISGNTREIVPIARINTMYVRTY